jgi:hypothetical protein
LTFLLLLAVVAVDVVKALALETLVLAVELVVIAAQ